MSDDLLLALTQGGVATVLVISVIIAIIRAPAILSGWRALQEARDEVIERSAERMAASNVALQAAVETLRDVTARALEESVRRESQWQDERRKMASSIEQLEANQQALQERAEQLERTLAERIRELEAAQKRLVEMEDEISRLRNELRQKTGDLAAANQHIAELREQLEQVQTDRERVKTERDDLVREVHQLRSELEALRNRLDQRQTRKRTAVAKDSATEGNG